MHSSKQLQQKSINDPLKSKEKIDTYRMHPETYSNANKLKPLPKRTRKRKSLQLEPTFSLAEVGAHLGLSHTAMQELINFGTCYGKKLHPTRGGLYPTFKGAKLRRIPLSAIERHKRHMARLDGITDLPPTPLIECQYISTNEICPTS